MSTERDKVIEALQNLSSRDAQYDLFCQSNADPERHTPLHLAKDLWISWVQDVYLPRQPGFTAAFSTEALEALEAFTEFFRGRLTLFPARFESLMIDVHWLSLVEYANVVLERLARDDALVAKDG